MSSGPGYESPRKSSPWILILLIGIPIALMLVLIVGVFSLGAIMGFQRRASRHRAPFPATVALDQRYSTKNGLLTLHYPADFAAQNLDDSTVLIQRTLPGSHIEAVLAAAVRVPISDDVTEFARVLLVDNAKFVTNNGGSYHELHRHDDVCVGGMPGLRVDGEQTYSTGTVAVVSTCFAIHGGHGYEFKTNVPKASAKAELPLLHRILDATELTEPAEKSN